MLLKIQGFIQYLYITVIVKLKEKKLSLAKMVLFNILLMEKVLRLVLTQLSAQADQNVSEILNITGWLATISKMFTLKQYAHIHISKS